MDQKRKKHVSAPLMLAFRSSFVGRAELGSNVPNGNASMTTIVATRNYAAKIAATEQLIRSEVRSDMSMLVNTVALESTLDLTEYPYVRASILNYGVPDIVSRAIDDHDIEHIGEELRAALEAFEPRLKGNTISIWRDPSANAIALALRFIVRGDLICNPVNVPVEFLADVEGQKITLRRL
jgi:type VI secretion system protein ImpF